MQDGEKGAIGRADGVTLTRAASARSSNPAALPAGAGERRSSISWVRACASLLKGGRVIRVGIGATSVAACMFTDRASPWRGRICRRGKPR